MKTGEFIWCGEGQKGLGSLIGNYGVSKTVNFKFKENNMKKLSKLIEMIPEDMKYYWKPNEQQKLRTGTPDGRKDQGWIHLSDLRKVLKELESKKK